MRGDAGPERLISRPRVFSLTRLAAAEERVADESAEAWNPERDRVIDNNSRRRVGRGRAVGDQRSGQPASNTPKPPGTGRLLAK